MLERHERDRLAEIESELVSDDPRLAAKFEQFGSGGDWGGLRRALVIMLLGLTATLSLMCLASGLTAVAVVLAVITTAGAGTGVCYLRRQRRGTD